MTFAISILKFFFQIKFFAKIFQSFAVAPHQQFFEKVEFLHDHEELGIDNGTVMFSERSPIRRRNNF